MRLWPAILSHIPQHRLEPFLTHRLRDSLDALRTILQKQLHDDLHSLGAWAGETAARALRAAHRRSVRENMADRRDPVEDPDAGGGVTLRTGELIVEPPSAFELARIVGPAPLRLTKLFDVDRIAATVWQGIADGKDRRAIAKDLAAKLNGDMVAARRVARTEGLRVATATTLQTAEQLGDDVIGYQIHAVLDERTRPEHRKRDGTIYYRNPGPGQKGFNEMPQPPQEPDGTIAFNCRCFLSPVWAD